MLSYLFDPFRSGRTDKSRQAKRRRQLRQTRSDQASGRGLSLAFQLLEPRLALTIYTSGDAQAGAIVPLTASGTFAYNIVIDDVEVSGYGRDAYLQRGNDGSAYFLLDDNPGFSNPKRLGLELATLGTCTTVFVSSGSKQTNSNDFASVLSLIHI